MIRLWCYVWCGLLLSSTTDSYPIGAYLDLSGNGSRRWCKTFVQCGIISLAIMLSYVYVCVSVQQSITIRDAHCVFGCEQH